MKKFLMKKSSLVSLLGFGLSVICYGNNGGIASQNGGVQQQTCKGGGCKRNVQMPNVSNQQMPSQKNDLMEKQLMYTSGNGGTTFAELLKDKKGLLIDFYASWCGPCMAELPSLKNKAEKLRPQGIEVVGVNVDKRDTAKAEKLRQERGIDFHWVMEGEDGVYSKQFNVTEIPRLVLLGQNGEVLFNGHPHDDKLVEALKRLGVSL